MRALLTPSNGTHKTIFFTGKGGVGKSSLSCVTAVHLAGQGFTTLLLTTDPAAHIGQVLGVPVGDHPSPVTGVPGLWAARIDPKTASDEYKARVLKDARPRYSAEMLAALREKLESPCTEEMAAFDKFAGYVDSDAYDVIVFDTAPTGHTLRLLELPFDYSQQVELMVATTQQGSDVRAETQARFASLIARLRDPERSVFVFVVYPESTPIVEAHRAMIDLKDAGIPTQLVVANQVIPADQATNRFFQSRREMQVRHLGEMDARFGVPLLVLPLLDREIRGLPVVNHAAALLFGPAGGLTLDFRCLRRACRMKPAVHLLTETAEHVIQIAFSCGCQNASRQGYPKAHQKHCPNRFSQLFIRKQSLARLRPLPRQNQRCRICPAKPNPKRRIHFVP